MSQLTLILPDAVADDLARASADANQTPVELVTDMVRRSLAVRKFRAARQTVLNALGSDAPVSDDAALGEIS